jgi:hypothetical protein
MRELWHLSIKQDDSERKENGKDVSDVKSRRSESCVRAPAWSVQSLQLQRIYSSDLLKKGT